MVKNNLNIIKLTILIHLFTFIEKSIEYIESSCIVDFSFFYKYEIYKIGQIYWLLNNKLILLTTIIVLEFRRLKEISSYDGIKSLKRELR